MRHAVLIAAREIRSYFELPIAYVVVPTFLVLTSVFLFFLNPFFLNDQATLRPFFEVTPFLFTLFAPAITMRSLAEERRSKTLDVLLTWPISEGALVLGKFMGALALLGLALALTLPAAATIAAIGPLDWGPVAGGYLGLLLVGAANLAIGLLISSVARSQVVAFIGGFGLCFALYSIGQVASVLPVDVARIVEQVGFRERFAPFARGVIDSRDIAYFLATTFVCLGLAREWLGRRRWSK